MRRFNSPTPPLEGQRKFYSVAQTAKIFGMSSMTLYRAIAEDQFPAVRIRGRLFVPVRAIDEMEAAATSGHTTVDAAAWVASKGE